MRYLVWCTGLVALVAASGTAIQAQSRSRADLQLGGWWHDRRSGVVMGATGWLNDNSGVAVRGVVGSLRSGHHLKGFEVMYRHRGFVGDFEIDFGVGSVLLRGHGWTRLNGIIEEVVEWAPVPAMDILVGRRFNERIGVKAGAGCHFLLGGGEDIPIWSVVKFMVVVPLGSL